MNNLLPSLFSEKDIALMLSEIDKYYVPIYDLIEKCPIIDYMQSKCGNKITNIPVRKLPTDIMIHEIGYTILKNDDGMFRLGKKWIEADISTNRIAEDCQIGSFHTHPFGNALLSNGDILCSRKYKDEIMLVGCKINGIRIIAIYYPQWQNKVSCPLFMLKDAICKLKSETYSISIYPIDYLQERMDHYFKKWSENSQWKIHAIKC